MPRTNRTPTQANPSFLARLRNRNQTKVTTTHSNNPITGTETTTTKKTHPKGSAHRGHSGKGSVASHSTTHHTNDRTAATHHRRKPGVGDKIGGAIMKLKGSVTRKPGLKGAGTKKMHGTDGKGSHRAY